MVEIAFATLIIIGISVFVSMMVNRWVVTWREENPKAHFIKELATTLLAIGFFLGLILMTLPFLLGVTWV